MGLVDYSDSDSDSETPQTKLPAAQLPPAKKTAPKLLNRSTTGKILVNLPSTSESAANSDDGPPAKRARIAEGSNTSSRFSGFSSFLPPPKNPSVVRREAQASGSSAAGNDVGAGGRAKAAPRVGLHLKTSAEAAFSRVSALDGDEEDDMDQRESSGSALGGLNLPPPKSSAKGPSIPEGQKPEEEVKLVGKPLMFKPLSVARKPPKKKNKSGTVIAGAIVKSQGTPAPAPAASSDQRAGAGPAEEAPMKKKVSLFSVDEEEPSSARGVEPSAAAGGYEPVFQESLPADDGLTEDYETVAQNAYLQHSTFPAAQSTRTEGQQNSLSSIADELNLSAKERRELFGRNGGNMAGGTANAKVVNFNMEREYAANEAIRASGEQVMHNPVRSIAPGKHSLRQVVNMAQTNQSALEESFARQRTNRNEAAGRYGWK
jgi:hypothetical protein